MENSNLSAIDCDSDWLPEVAIWRPKLEVDISRIMTGRVDIRTTNSGFDHNELGRSAGKW